MNIHMYITCLLCLFYANRFLVAKRLRREATSNADAWVTARSIPSLRRDKHPALKGLRPPE